MYSFPYLEPVCCFMSSSNCCFLTCVQISQEPGQLVPYSHPLKNFPQFVVIHIVKGFGVVNKAKVFLKLSCFFYDPVDFGNMISGSSVSVSVRGSVVSDSFRPMHCSMPGLPVHHQLPEFTQTHVHPVSDGHPAISSCHPLLPLPPIPPNIRVFSNESTPRMRWPKYWNFSFSQIYILALISFHFQAAIPTGFPGGASGKEHAC